MLQEPWLNGTCCTFGQGVWTFVDQRQLRWQREEGRRWRDVVILWCRDVVQPKVTGGRNGYGAKLTNIFSKKSETKWLFLCGFCGFCGFCGPFRKFFYSAWCNGQVGWRDLIQSQWSKVWNWVWRFGTQEEIPSNVGGTSHETLCKGCGECRHVSIPPARPWCQHVESRTLRDSVVLRFYIACHTPGLSRAICRQSKSRRSLHTLGKASLSLRLSR